MDWEIEGWATESVVTCIKVVGTMGSENLTVALPLRFLVVTLTVGATSSSFSKAPMSQLAVPSPLPSWGRFSPRWSVAGHESAQESVRLGVTAVVGQGLQAGVEDVDRIAVLAEGVVCGVAGANQVEAVRLE